MVDDGVCVHVITGLVKFPLRSQTFFWMFEAFYKHICIVIVKHIE